MQPRLIDLKIPGKNGGSFIATGHRNGYTAMEKD